MTASKLADGKESPVVNLEGVKYPIARGSAYQYPHPN